MPIARKFSSVTGDSVTPYTPAASAAARAMSMNPSRVESTATDWSLPPSRNCIQPFSRSLRVEKYRRSILSISCQRTVAGRGPEVDTPSSLRVTVVNCFSKTDTPNIPNITARMAMMVKAIGLSVKNGRMAARGIAMAARP